MSAPLPTPLPAPPPSPPGFEALAGAIEHNESGGLDSTQPIQGGGVMQVTQHTGHSVWNAHPELQQQFPEVPPNVDPVTLQNLMNAQPAISKAVGRTYLRGLYDQFQGDPIKTAVAYNSGPDTASNLSTADMLAGKGNQSDPQYGAKIAKHLKLTDAQGNLQVLAPDGSPCTVSPKEWEEAKAQGYQLDTPAAQAQRQAMVQNSTGWGMATSFAAGALESIPFLGGPLEQGLMGDVSAQKQANPGSNLAGGAALILGQTLVTGGLGDLLGAGSAAADLGTAAKVARGALEGGFYGAGSAVNESVLTNHPLTAEMLLEQAGGGALLGGVLSGGLSVVGAKASEEFEGVGNRARANALGHAVDADAAKLEAAGIGTQEINAAFKDGLIQYGDTPLDVQSRLAAKKIELQKGLGEFGQAIDGSKQTFDLPSMFQKAKLPEDLSGYLQPGDDAANFGRVGALRQVLQGQAGEAVEKLRNALDETIFSKAGSISPELEGQARQLLASGDRVTALSEMADAAMANGPSPKGGLFSAVLRQGEHISMWKGLSTVAHVALGGHLGAGAFLADHAGNFMRQVIEDPMAIGETYAKAVKGVTEGISDTSERMGAAIKEAIGERLSGAGGKLAPVSSKVLQHFGLPTTATTEDVEAARGNLVKQMANPVPNGGAAVAGAISRIHQTLAAALPPPPAAALPQAFDRPVSPSAKTIAKYNETLQAVSAPLDVVKRIRTGQATLTQLTAIKNAYPNLSTRIAQGLYNASAESGKRAPMPLRRAVEILSGQSVDPAVTPMKIARVQQIFQDQTPPPGRGGQAPGGGQVKLNQKGLSEVDIAGRMAMQADQITSQENHS